MNYVPERRAFLLAVAIPLAAFGLVTAIAEYRSAGVASVAADSAPATGSSPTTGSQSIDPSPGNQQLTDVERQLASSGAYIARATADMQEEKEP
jgi:hypothetical protein